ncbi:MAG: hypothetical protein WDO70_09995 [Alphaproteobacteria bacterium]
MADDRKNKDRNQLLAEALRETVDGPAVIARELRLMAAAKDDIYKRFRTASPWIKNVWHAAADMLEECGRRHGR